MSASRVVYLDSSAIVKLVVHEDESAALRAFLRGRGPFVSSALARTEVARAVLEFGDEVARRAQETLDRIELVRINDRVLLDAGALRPAVLRSLDAIHLATALLFGKMLRRFVVYDERLGEACRTLGLKTASPS